jgi:hypothetical protein
MLSLRVSCIRIDVHRVTSYSFPVGFDCYVFTHMIVSNVSVLRQVPVLVELPRQHGHSVPQGRVP